MTDQVVIEFPELTKEEYKALVNIREKMIVKVWKSDERKTHLLEWEGTKLCCPMIFWYDFPEGLSLSKEDL